MATLIPNISTGGLKAIANVFEGYDHGSGSSAS
jgi:hypothetical protein